jgi:hypothetical protein
MTRAPLLALAITLLPGLATRAQAADPAEVEALIRQGVDLRVKGRDHEAVGFFQRAYDLEQSPRTAGQLGLAEMAMGYWLAAERHLNESLASRGHPWVMKNRAQLELTVKEVRKNIGELEVTGTPVGAEVIVNGKTEGVLPLGGPLRVAEGQAQLVVRAPGFQERLVPVTISGGKREQVAIVLSAGQGPTTSGASGGVDLVGVQDGGGRRGAPTWVRPAAFVTGGLAIVALGVASYGYFDMHQSENAFNDKKMPGTIEPACSTQHPQNGSSAECEALYRQGVSSQKLGFIGLSSSIVLAAASVAGLLWSASGSDGAVRESGAVASASADGFSASWRMRF